MYCNIPHIIFIFISVLMQCPVRSITPNQEADLYLTTQELIVKNGYPAETHTLTTPDGYILNMHRIPYSPKSPTTSNRPVVFFQHGLMASSADFVLLGPQEALAYLLADAGYDVFMGNCRGNMYSKSHVNLSSDDRQFWNFSFHEMAVYDLPTMIDYVLNITHQKQIYYIGMSMGTTLFFVLTSEKPEYNQKIKLMIALAPIVFFDTKNHKSVTAGRALTLFTVAFYLLGFEELFPRNWVFPWLSKYVCATEYGRYYCNVLFRGEIVPKLGHVNETLLPLVYSHFPVGCSLKTAIHYVQLYLTGKFEKWDYEPEMNMIKYKQPNPPQYNLSAVTAPVALLYSVSDLFTFEEKIMQLSKSVKNCIEVYKVPDKTLTHLEFVFGSTAKQLIYGKVMKLLQAH